MRGKESREESGVWSHTDWSHSDTLVSHRVGAVSLASLDDLNGKLSACGFSLYRDPDRNYVFRVLYSGCFVHLEHGNYVVSLSLTKRTSRFGSRSSAFAMKCPLVRAPPSGEHVMCDSDFIQVSVCPQGALSAQNCVFWKKKQSKNQDREDMSTCTSGGALLPTPLCPPQLPWSLALRGKVVVALEDASLIRLSVETDGVNITVQGRRAEILSPEEVLDTPGTFLPLRLVSGHYSYSMEASCPTGGFPSHPSRPAAQGCHWACSLTGALRRLAGSDSPVDETVLYIYKRRMGLVKRGGGDGEVLSLSAISVKQTDSFSVFESSDLVRIALNTSLILRTRRCMGPAGKQLIQPFFRVDAVLTFKETPHHLVWSLENLLPCTGVCLFASVCEQIRRYNNSVTGIICFVYGSHRDACIIGQLRKSYHAVCWPYCSCTFRQSCLPVARFYCGTAIA
ncbi:hypothetical protein Z043_122307 [Scleropages formosus]|uniref:CIROZ beta domain-containing protein n=1 Tax=Scleropages formosus TaxID=113540 RepID=A0A0P7W9V0_SCLFO|nr:hypothetical protein Z043_122307 [Scleropages formosus]